jgi:general secretion pathway protein H
MGKSSFNRFFSLLYSSKSFRIQQGFTLVELLVVLVVMGIALGIVVVQLMPDDRAALREEAARLALLLENAGLEARSSGRSMAWSAENNGYLFWKKNNYNDWARIEDDSMFRPRKLPEGTRIGEITLEDQPLKPGEQIALSASAYAPPFRIKISNATASATINGKSTGEVIVQLLEAPAGITDRATP